MSSPKKKSGALKWFVIAVFGFAIVLVLIGGTSKEEDTAAVEEQSCKCARLGTISSTSWATCAGQEEENDPGLGEKARRSVLRSQGYGCLLAPVITWFKNTGTMPAMSLLHQRR